MSLGEIMDLEGQKVIEYGKYNDKSLGSITGSFSEMMSKYIGETDEEVDLVIIHGNSSNAQVTVISKNSTGTITLNTGADYYSIQSSGYHLNTTTVGSNNVSVTLLNTTYPFELGEDEEFVFVMTKSEGFEHYVRSNKN